MEIADTGTLTQQMYLSGVICQEEIDENSIYQEKLGNADGQQTEAVVETVEDENTVPKEEPNGVIRLLQEGHFKGVADVRLRINFFETLNTINQDEIASSVGEKITDIKASLNEKIQGLLSSEELLEEQQHSIVEKWDTFSSATELMKDDFFSDSAMSNEDLILSMGSGFENFISKLKLILVLAEAETPGEDLLTTDSDVIEPIDENDVQEEFDEVAESDQNTGITTDYQEYILSLKADFSGWLDELDQLMNQQTTTTTLPDITVPKGNGKAFEKFMALYQNLALLR